MMNNSRLQEVANIIMRKCLEQEILDNLVGEKMIHKDAELSVYTQALHFESLDDYDNAIARRKEDRASAEAEINAVRNTMQKGIEGMAEEDFTEEFAAKLTEEFEKATRDIADPYIFYLEESTLELLAFAYIYLLGRLDLATCYYPDIPDAHNLISDCVLDKDRSKAIEVMKDLGLDEEWEELIASKTASPPTISPKPG